MRLSFLLPMLLLLVVSAGAAWGQGIQFIQGSWEQVQAQARQTGKPVFVYAGSVFCSPCVVMEKTVLREDTAGTYFNATFLSYKVDIDKGPGPAFAQQHDIISVPTYLFFAPDGTPLHRSTSGKSAAGLVADGQAALNPQQAFYSLQRRYQAGDRTAELLYTYSQALEAAGPMQRQPPTDVAAEYLQTQPLPQWRTEKNLRFQFEQTSPVAVRFLLENRRLFEPYFSAAQVQERVDTHVKRLASDAGGQPQAGAFAELRRLILTTTPAADTARLSSLATIRYLQARRAWLPYAQATLRYARQPGADLRTLVETATYMRHFGKELEPARQQEALRVTAELLPLLLQRHKTADNVLLHAYILQQLHQQKAAATAAREAATLARLAGQSDEEAKKLLAELQTSQPSKSPR